MTPLRPRLPLGLLGLGLALHSGHGLADDSVALAPVRISDVQDSGYQAREALVGGLHSTPLLDTPAAVSVFSRQLLDDRQVRKLSEVLQSDASVGESYAPIGYYENFNVRGFELNAASSYRVNGQTIAGEQNVALENKQQVELLKGLSGLQSGVSEPGGLVNYVTKRPEDVRSLSVSSNEQGERYLATDLGGWFGAERQLGLRVNLAHEDIRSYVDHADGKRDFASLALDWQLNPNAVLELDAEYQHREQYSVPGYQLLGGTQLPHGVDPKDHLAWQSWAKPVQNDSLNLGGRFKYQFNDNWNGTLSASRSKVVIDDYSAFAWGSSEGSYFGSNGDYDIYDFRSPDDTRRIDEAQATLDGRFDALGVSHELTVGTSAQRRTLDQRPGYNEWRGTGNIHTGAPAVEPSDKPIGSSERRLDSRQYGLFFSDRITFNDNWQTVIGAREVRLDEKTWDQNGVAGRHTRQYQLLPNAALIYKPQPDTTLYASYAKGLSSGGTAPWYASNAFEILAPTLSRQLEVGIKRDWQGMSFSAALFQIRQAYQYARPNENPAPTYVQSGQQKNTGLELGASGWVTSNLQIQASAAAIRARVQNSDTVAYEGHQAINVPRLRAALQADYALPVPGLALLGGARYSASKYASSAGNVEVGGYTVFDIGSRYRTNIGGYDTVLRLTVDNVFDKRYWRDVGDYLGDNYLFQGAPRTARLSASVSF
ncbi:MULTISPECIES: TonB-dependent siderophore receptor [unclassified Pseudomonas]|uniref:TonB-dependent siderophore receptor n=2 Tax=Pseudomonas TaxID=286 RepID=UPI000C888285|nr:MULTISPECIES: TonB-dependent siderophore receptor [unclassified Pseudomonas]PMZ93956.1 TonB-dependent siderophore receptor [Pseudomonas sp. FW305-42]PNA24626.1 TonB-dependent siderophore receptor [Pseudomonas sp. MPR-R1B]PNB23165.1 TonB-dependent siderophore receptor [Pseudomonas sp. DP16D-E2]PNB43197.1 TonB-dependent siderophore receptor [Pseudomonas sp. FW305-17]PNB56089.1 TonB-dependent siderophore receptor [Pseudomonas sp. GW531-E2]